MESVKPWSQLTAGERKMIARQMFLSGGTSKNGVPGWYHVQRQKGMLPRPMRIVINTRGTSIADDGPEPLELEDIRDVIR